MSDNEWICYRFRELEDAEKPADDGKIRLLASTDSAVDWGGWREILVHSSDSIDVSAARALLLNHRSGMIAGTISDMHAEGGTLSANAEIDSDARMESGVSVRKAVASGALRGVSVGYTYRNEDVAWDETSRTATVRKWRLLEISLTPIPADARAQVRSLPDGIRPTPVAPAIVAQEVRVSDPVTPNAQGIKPADINTADLSEKARASAMAEQREIAEMAESQGLRVSDYLNKSKVDAQTAMLRDLAAKRASPAPETPPAQPAVILEDQADKARDAFAGAMAHRIGFRSGQMAEHQKANPLLGRGMREGIRRYAKLVGERTDEWTNADVAWYALGKPENMSRGGRAASVTSAMFQGFVFLDSITKIVGMGFERGAASSRYQRIVSRQTVPDFKAFTIGGLSAGNFSLTAENVAFPELSKQEGFYSSSAKMWGGTLSLTQQAIANDDTGSFDRMASQAGAIADKTMDRRCFQKLLMGTSADEGTSTWTSNTTSGGSLVYTTADLAAAARGRLGLVRAAMMNKVGLDGNPTGNAPRFLIVPVTREMEAQGIVGGSGPLLNSVGPAQPAVQSMEVIASNWLEASALTGNSTTSYYLLADPNEATGLVLTEVAGYQGIQAETFDAGAVAAINIKLWKPFEVDLVYITVGATATITAAQQGTT